MINQKKLAAVFALMAFAIPLLVLGQEASAGLIPCDGPNCTFASLVTLANNIIKFLLFKVSIPLAAVGFMYAGAKLILNQKKESAWSEAKESFLLMGQGFGIMLGAYVLIKVVLYAFLTTEQINFMGFLLQ